MRKTKSVIMTMLALALLSACSGAAKGPDEPETKPEKKSGQGDMETLLIIDAKNYEPDLEEICRVSVRGIIFLDDKLLLVEDESGEVKLPGGEIENGEDDIEALVREVKEETGYDVIPETVRAFGEVEEKRLSKHEPMIWHQYNRLYFCDVGNEKGQSKYTENEKKYGLKQVSYTLDEAIEKNKSMLDQKGEQSWNQREYQTLLLLKEHLADK